MRERLLETLPRTRYRRFLVYVMGPYKAHAHEDEAQFAFLKRVRDGLRDAGLNAFLATDIDIPLTEMDAGTQSLEFARASNVVLFVVPSGGRNLGVGIEVGAVLEDRMNTPGRVLFVHETGVRSAMIAAVADRWNATIDDYEDDVELLERAKLFSRDVMERERTGDLPTLD
ncbi:hypothetical protein U3A55_02970 [Salarchaeum sp. III]|uniref:DUF7509 family protein n=1 Tax=Salarchaeum sp. III TaxID=3107927 RepID=UPI002ED80D19